MMQRSVEGTCCQDSTISNVTDSPAFPFLVSSSRPSVPRSLQISLSILRVHLSGRCHSLTLMLERPKLRSPSSNLLSFEEEQNREKEDEVLDPHHLAECLFKINQSTVLSGCRDRRYGKKGRTYVRGSCRFDPVKSEQAEETAKHCTDDEEEDKSFSGPLFRCQRAVPFD
jgi:hypothetical protein